MNALQIHQRLIQSFKNHVATRHAKKAKMNTDRMNKVRVVSRLP